MNREVKISVDPETLSRVVGKPRDRGKHNRLDDEDMLVIKQLHADGVPITHIARLLHIHRSSIYRALDRMGQS